MVILNLNDAQMNAWYCVHRKKSQERDIKRKTSDTFMCFPALQSENPK